MFICFLKILFDLIVLKNLLGNLKHLEDEHIVWLFS